MRQGYGKTDHPDDCKHRMKSNQSQYAAEAEGNGKTKEGWNAINYQIASEPRQKLFIRKPNNYSKPEQYLLVSVVPGWFQGCIERSIPFNSNIPSLQPISFCRLFLRDGFKSIIQMIKLAKMILKSLLSFLKKNAFGYQRHFLVYIHFLI